MAGPDSVFCSGRATTRHISQNSFVHDSQLVPTAVVEQVYHAYNMHVDTFKYSFVQMAIQDIQIYLNIYILVSFIYISCICVFHMCTELYILCLTCSCIACCLLQKDAKQLPGKKGISLPADQFQKLLGAHSALTEALAASETQFEVPLSGK